MTSPKHESTSTPRKVADGDEILNRIETNTAAAKRLINSLLGTKPLGSGTEKIVYEYGDRRAVAFFYRNFNKQNAEALKRQYFTNKLMHLLLP